MRLARGVLPRRGAGASEPGALEPGPTGIGFCVPGMMPGGARRTRRVSFSMFAMGVTPAMVSEPYSQPYA